MAPVGALGGQSEINKAKCPQRALKLQRSVYIHFPSPSNLASACLNCSPVIQPVRDCLLKDCRLTFSKNNHSKHDAAQFGPIVDFVDAIPGSTLSSKQLVPQLSKHNCYKWHDMGPESTV